MNGGRLHHGTCGSCMHSHPPPRYDRSCSTNASMVGMRAENHALRHLQKLCVSIKARPLINLEIEESMLQKYCIQK